MKLSFSTKVIVVTFLIGICSMQTNARRLYKWVDSESITNYSEFKPKAGSERKLQVLESRGSDHVDPAMAVTAEMKPLEIPVDMVNAASSPVASEPETDKKRPVTMTVYKQGVRTQSNETFVNPTLKLVEDKQVVDTKVQSESLTEKQSSAVVVVEKIEKKHTEKEMTAMVQPEKAVVQPEKKIEPKVNPWTREPNFVPSNLVPNNLPKTKNP